MKRILIVEDDRALGDGVRLALQHPELEAVLCRSLAEARTALESRPFHLAVLDVNLPDGSGLDLLRQIRQSSSLPVILLTANDMETDIVTGLESGADDYITKPFSLAVLRARVNAQLRRGEPPAPDRVELPPFSFDFGRMEFRRDGVLIELSKTEQKLLRVLVDRVWTDGAEYVDENALSVTVKRLRSKLEDNPSRPQYLKTVYGLGYTWTITL